MRSVFAAFAIVLIAGAWPSAALAQTFDERIAIAIERAEAAAEIAAVDVHRIERAAALVERASRKAGRARAAAENADDETYLAAWEREREAIERAEAAAEAVEDAKNSLLNIRFSVDLAYSAIDSVDYRAADDAERNAKNAERIAAEIARLRAQWAQ